MDSFTTEVRESDIYDGKKPISMKSFGTHLGTRASGREAYAKIMSETHSLEVPAVFDFEGVKTITNSFADEVFGRMAMNLGLQAMKSRTSFKNVDPFWAHIIRAAIDFRDTERKLAAV